MAFGNELVARSTAFLLGAFSGEQVTEARRTTDQLARGGQFEAFGYGLFGLLHEKSGRKQGAQKCMARANFRFRSKIAHLNISPKANVQNPDVNAEFTKALTKNNVISE